MSSLYNAGLYKNVFNILNSFQNEIQSSNNISVLALELSERILKNIDYNELKVLCSELEEFIKEANKKYAEGISIISDMEYDFLVELLSRLKPNSEVLGTVWSEDYAEIQSGVEYDKFLKLVPMKSIKSLFSADKDKVFLEKCLWEIEIGNSIVTSLKYDGYAIRMVYVDGKFYNATTRGRYNKGKDITDKLKYIVKQNITDGINRLYEKYSKVFVMNKNEFNKLMSIIEIRGEILIARDKFHELKQKFAAKGIELSNERNSVASFLMRDELTHEDLIELSDYIYVRCYDLLTDFHLEYLLRDDNRDKAVNDGFLKFSNRLEDLSIIFDDNIICNNENSNIEDQKTGVAKYFIVDNGFNAVFQTKSINEFVELLITVAETVFSEEKERFLSDGIVLRLNTVEGYVDFNEAETISDEKYVTHSRALKMGKYWGNKIYRAKVLQINWSYGTKYITPIAIIEPVQTAGGRKITRVALKSLQILYQNLIVPGAIIEFEYVSEIVPRFLRAVGYDFISNERVVLDPRVDIEYETEQLDLMDNSVYDTNNQISNFNESEKNVKSRRKLRRIAVVENLSFFDNEFDIIENANIDDIKQYIEQDEFLREFNSEYNS